MYINIPIIFKRTFTVGDIPYRNVQPPKSIYENNKDEQMKGYNFCEEHNQYENIKDYNLYEEYNQCEKIKGYSLCEEDNKEDKYSDYYKRAEKQPVPQKVIDNYEILDFKKGDVTGDGVPDNVYLLGKGVKGSPNFKEDIRVLVEDGKTKKTYYMDMKSNAGYEANLFLADFTGDGKEDILVSIASGGSGGFYFYYMFTFRNGNFVKIFDYEDFSQNQKYEAIYRNNYRVEIISEDGKERYSIDISHRNREYLDQFYDKNGNLIKPEKGDVSGLNTLFPIYPTFGLKSKFGLLTLQRITGTYSADGLGYLQTYVNYEDDMFKKVYSQVAINEIGK